MLVRLLLAAQDAALKRRIQRLLESQDVVVESLAPTALPLVTQLAQSGSDLALVDRDLMGDQAGDLLSQLRGLPEAPEIVVLSRHEDPEDRARLLAAGCLLHLHAGVSNPALHDALAAVIVRRRQSMDEALSQQWSALHPPRLADFVSSSSAMQAFLQVVRRVAPSDASLLVSGETGVGKERLARAIHAESPRQRGPFVTVNCGALPETLLESELFGHEEGAFTGASRARRGWFELAHGGVVFLDEIGEMPPHLQVKLLHVLQNHQLQRLGSERTTSIDVRVIAATNRDLLAEVEQGRFRRDLYYRLGVVHLTIPPLRARPEDIAALAASYLTHFRTTSGRSVEAITPEASQALIDYAWPGNVRELMNVMERAVLLCDGDQITPGDLPDNIAASRASRTEHFAADGWVLPRRWLEQPLGQARRSLVREFERAYLSHWLAAHCGRIRETAQAAGIDPRSLYDKMRQLDLRKEDFKRRGASAAPCDEGGADPPPTRAKPV